MDSGRQRVYELTPSMESFAAINPALAGTAAKILTQSDLARQSAIFYGEAGRALPPQEFLDVASTAPTVVPLSGTVEQVMGCSWKSVV